MTICWHSSSRLALFGNATALCSTLHNLGDSNRKRLGQDECNGDFSTAMFRSTPAEPQCQALLEIQPPIFRQLEHREENLATCLDQDVFAVRYLALFFWNNRQNNGLDRILPQLKVVIGW
jgi:hypothetical protein